MNKQLISKLEMISELFQIRINDLHCKDQSHLHIRYAIYDILSPYLSVETIAGLLHRHPVTIKRAVEINRKRRAESRTVENLYFKIKEIFES